MAQEQHFDVLAITHVFIVGLTHTEWDKSLNAPINRCHHVWHCLKRGDHYANRDIVNCEVKGGSAYVAHVESSKPCRYPVVVL